MEDLPADKLARFGPERVDGTQISLYAKKHNPFVLFDDVKNNPARMAKVKDYSQLGADLDKRNAPQFVWISPNQCNDMHGGVYDTRARAPGDPVPLRQHQGRRQRRRPQAEGRRVREAARSRTITRSKAWTKQSAIVIVTDENDYTGNAETGGWESADGCCDSPVRVEAATRGSAPTGPAARTAVG